MTGMAEVFYMWKESVLITRDERGELLAKPTERLLTPHSDPRLYEFPIDFQFDNMRAAMDWRDEEIEIAIDTNDDEYLAECMSWILVKITMEPWNEVMTTWTETATRILKERQ